MLSWLTTEISPRALGLARIVVGVACAIRAILAWPTLNALARPQTFRVPYAAWLPEPTAQLVVALVLVWFLAAVLFALGWRVALVGPMLLLAIGLNLALDQQTYDNHVYMMAWLVFLLTLADAGAGISIAKQDRPVVRWPVLLLMTQLSIVYGFSGLTKLNSIFLSGASLAGVLSGGLVPYPDSLRTPELLSVVAVVVVFVELFVAVTMWRPRFRPFAFVLGLGLHLSITLLMESTAQLLVFSLLMLSLYPLFLDAEPLRVSMPAFSNLRTKVGRLDLLRVVDLVGEAETLTLHHQGRVTTGAAAHARILEHLVPWLWVAPLLRLPGVREVHGRLWRHRVSGDRTGALDRQ